MFVLLRKFSITVLIISASCFGSVSHSIQEEQMFEKTSTNSYPVGELGELWQFPSDHLPVGGTIGNVHFAIWNVLNTDYIHWIEENGQGLKDSLIISSNRPSNSSLTIREEIVFSMIIQMLWHPTHPRSVIALQELGAPVYEVLKQRLPKHYQIYPRDLGGETMEDIFIVDTHVFDVLDYTFTSYSFSENTLSKIILLEKFTGLPFCFIQSHVPGGPVKSVPARAEFANYVLENYYPGAFTILLGDMNRSPDYFMVNFAQAAQQRGIKQPFQIMEVPYPTHVNTEREASWIDNIFIATPFTQTYPTGDQAGELLLGLPLVTQIMKVE